ncbi:MAG: PilC/PilY family type IV pilus protein, partial [Dokdonella sp.]
MKTSPIQSISVALTLTLLAGFGTSPRVQAQAASGGIDVSQQPLFTQVAEAPLNMLVMGKDHKIYYEAYNDASDLNGDGALDIGYKPAIIDYYGNFNSFICYTWASDKFVPSSATADKKCSGKWSGDFLNYLTTSRMDALRRVLYGGWRQVDTATETVLQGAYFPQDGHSWGKEYQSAARDGYVISEYAPLTAPVAGRFHLFAVTTLKGNGNAYPGYQAPVLRVLTNTDKRVWNWLSIEGPVAGNKCFTSGNSRTDCVPSSNSGTGTWDVVPPSDFSGLTITTWKHNGTHPANTAAMNTFFTTYATSANLCGTGTVSLINTTGSDNNPFAGTNGCTHENYLTRISGQLLVPTAGTFRFAVDGDDAVDVLIDGNVLVGWYDGHGNNRNAASLMSHSAEITLTAGTHTVEFRHEEVFGGDNWGLLGFTGGAVVGLTDYEVRVQSCPSSNAAFRETSCKSYPNGQYKPTGILHDYGETSRMYFGLITGTQYNNLEGGVLRRNMGSFGDEINANTGQFKTSVDGIANTISEFRMIGGDYNSGSDNTNADSNWNWGNGTGSCPSQGSSPLLNGECRMWGNPLAEMLYESMRYYAGAASPTSRFNTLSNPGSGEETTMNLKKDTWKDPYGAVGSGGGGFPICARPFQTIISDINPSYDGDLPGSAFTGAITSTGTTPATISGFNAASEGQAIWTAEFGGGSKSVFIGDVNNVTDGVPTAKTASSFGNIRGLSPEEPTKGGTYYTASVARYARLNDVNAAPGPQKVSTYAIALASPLPRIDFPVGNGKVTLLPFGKTASGTFGTGARKPTNTIVDFYVESIANLPNQPFNSTINGGRPFAVFRINYEDVEQGNDHDMDAIVRYLISANADNTVTVTLNSEYAAGSADQNMGYVMSGTTEDGVYLDVRDSDSGAGSFMPYGFNTPNPILPGGCAIAIPPAACASQLPLTSTRTFTPTASNATGGAIFLNDPLWYAAKYGAPVPGNTDVDGDGVPDNYFLVTNPATLRTQLDKAFQDIITQSLPSASIATSSPRYVQGSSLAYEVSYNANDWTGDLKAYQLAADGTYANATPIWSASAKMPVFGLRNIYTGQGAATSTTVSGVPFTVAGMSTTTMSTLQGALDPAVFVPSELIDYLRGDKSREVSQPTCTPTTCMYRKRSTNLGDVLNSTPAVIGVTSFGYSLLPTTIAGAAAVNSYEAYVTSKKSIYGNSNNQPIIFVGSNDGMVHAFDGRETSGGGVELFAYVPRSIIGNIHELARPNYIHKYFVDGTPSIADAYFGGGWKSVLVASVGAGGKGIYALDITNPRTFDGGDVMWEFDSSVDPSMGQFVGRPAIGISENTGAGRRWIAAFGNGYNSVNQRAVLFVRRLDNGNSIARIDTGVG